MTDSQHIDVLELARILAQTPTRTVIKPMHQMETMGPDGPERIETGLIRLELPMPGYLYIRESSYTRHPDLDDRVSFSKATSFVRRLKEDDSAANTVVVDQDGEVLSNNALCTLIDALPHLQHFDLSAFSATTKH